jgi:uncharacterized protein (DUF697 family)
MNNSSATFSEKISDLISSIDTYASPYAMSVSPPDDLIRHITRKTAIRCASLAGAFYLFPGKMNYALILPELLLIYRLQAQMIIDIAALYGKDNPIDKTLLFYCLFQGSNSDLLKHLIKDTGKRVIVRPVSIKMVEAFIQQLSKSFFKKSFSRYFSVLLPLLGFTLSGSLNYLYTTRIGEVASQVFSKEIFIAPTKNEK